MTSEFGKGMTYCIAMFLMHDFQYLDLDLQGSVAYVKLSNASDHLLELDIESFDGLCKPFHDKVCDYLDLGYDCTDEHWKELRNMGLALLRELDRRMGIEVVQGVWE